VLSNEPKIIVVLVCCP